MEKKEYITTTEREIMDYLWSADHKITFRELLSYCNTELGKNWKKQTLSTYLIHLQKAGLIDVDNSKKNYLYYPACTKNEYHHRWTRKLVEEFFGNSVSNLVATFVGDGKLSDEEKENLKKLI
ncbi:MAG: BlaI/MecI/CopY family transcriptional regulator [Lachnospiraceae bacterium]|jgi:predicted transcriptional regulator|nr:BlaI/MecI/CopY family transcriptional regulator [Lachnospiraceae bacterium]